MPERLTAVLHRDRERWQDHGGCSLQGNAPSSDRWVWRWSGNRWFGWVLANCATRCRHEAHPDNTRMWIGDMHVNVRLPSPIVLWVHVSMALVLAESHGACEEMDVMLLGNRRCVFGNIRVPVRGRSFVVHCSQIGALRCTVLDILVCVEWFDAGRASSTLAVEEEDEMVVGLGKEAVEMGGGQAC
jgi:hypothetical protein